MKSIVAGLMTIGVLGCAQFTSVNPLSSEDNQRIYIHNYDTTWWVVLEVLNHHDLPITTMEKKEGNIATDFVVVNPNQSSNVCPTRKVFEKVLGARYKLTVSVRSMEEKTRVIINAHHERLSQSAGVVGAEDSPTWKPQKCPNMIESQLFSEIGSMLSQ